MEKYTGLWSSFKNHLLLAAPLICAETRLKLKADHTHQCQVLKRPIIQKGIKLKCMDTVKTPTNTALSCTRRFDEYLPSHLFQTLHQQAS